MCKKTLGNSAGSLIHLIMMEHGCEVSRKFFAISAVKNLRRDHADTIAFAFLAFFPDIDENDFELARIFLG